MPAWFAAIDVVQIALDTFGAPIYVRKEIVHNSYVVNDLAQKGAIFVNELDEVSGRSARDLFAPTASRRPCASVPRSAA